MGMSFFSIQQLSYLNYGPVDLSISAAEIVGLYGESGSGKTRLLRALADMDEHQGTVQLGAQIQSETKAPLWRQQVGLLSAETSWWKDTVGEHFKQFSVEHAQALGFTADIAEWPVSRLSSGENQRLGLMRLLENKPAVLLLDEPTANLDPQNTRRFEMFVKHYVKTELACAIWVSHDAEQLSRVAQRCFRIEQGRLILDNRAA